jgi:hypothetical protein
MSETESQPILKIKRVYKKKTTNTPVEEIFNDVPSGYVPDVVELPRGSSSDGQSIEKPKRKYTRKIKETPIVASEPKPEPKPEPSPTIPSPPETSSSEDETPSPIKEKKPRTDKQILAFNKMREARSKKQQELQHLKEISKQQVLLDKEQAKLEKVEEKIIKQKAQRKPRAKKEPELEYNDPPQHIQVTNLKPLVFV